MVTVNRVSPTYSINGEDVITNVYVNSGDLIKIISKGYVNFSLSGFPTADANGEYHTGRYIPAPPGFPAAGLIKHSLIWRINNSQTWYQGAVNRIFTVRESGKVILRANDKDTWDNTSHWLVAIHVIEDQELIYLLKAINTGNDSIDKINLITSKSKEAIINIINDLKNLGLIRQSQDDNSKFMISYDGEQLLKLKIKGCTQMIQDIIKPVEEGNVEKVKSVISKIFPFMPVLGLIFTPQEKQKLVNMILGSVKSNIKGFIKDTISNDDQDNKSRTPDIISTNRSSISTTAPPNQISSATPQTPYGVTNPTIPYDPNNVHIYYNTMFVTPPAVLPTFTPTASMPNSLPLNFFDPLYIPPPEVAAPLLFHSPIYQNYWNQASQPNVYFQGNTDNVIDASIIESNGGFYTDIPINDGPGDFSEVDSTSGIYSTTTYSDLDSSGDGFDGGGFDSF